MVYTTQELKFQLDYYKGSLSDQFDKAHKANDLCKMNMLWYESFSYHDIRDQIHKYQHENNVSGIDVKKFTLGNKKISLPYAVNDLCLIDGDLQILELAKHRYTDFWLDFVRHSPHLYFFYSHTSSKGYELEIQTTYDYMFYECSNWEWAQFYQLYGTDEIFCFSLGIGDVHDSQFLNTEADSISFHFSSKCRLPVVK
jgi:hypothetical protein